MDINEIGYHELSIFFHNPANSIRTLMNKQHLNQNLSKKIADLYQRMEEAYDKVAEELGFSCEGCPDNCCDSFFLHHTYIEWAYLREGLEQLPAGKIEEIRQRASRYILESERALAKGERPQIMCPLNDEGLCSLYKHRLMICRMHGVPAAMTLPDGRKMEFPGCFRCQEQVGENEEVPRVERTGLYRELVMLESDFIGNKRHMMPKVKMTIAEMIVKGSPHF